MKSLLLLVGLLVFSNLSQANLHLAPPNISIGRTKAIFIDIKTIKSTIVYDLGKNKAVAKSEIEFSQGLSGYPIFDLLPTPIKVTINGEVTQTQTTSMDGVSTVRYIKKSLSSGLHKMTIENEISKNISWNSNYLKNAFWMSDLSDRRYIEQYLPTNLEFDQYKKTLSIKIIGTDREHNLVTNGDVKSLGLNEWLVDYPEVYTASSFFYHLTLKGQIPTVYSTYRSIDNREIPITVYTSQGTSKFMNKTKEVLAELERDYGPWPHSQVIVYGAGMGGMEHCGATITSFSALGHELIHSYFARGVMPAHGNA
ncbi:hypothetical protein OAT67_09440 [Bacteriovoracaceae bacterium]|nr:hypothetical protein [Bacteriovoracaceae bacterium]